MEDSSESAWLRCRVKHSTHLFVASTETQKLLVLISLLTVLMIHSTGTTACPRMQCAPIISKCQLIDACRCEAKLNYTCFKTCSHCLGDLYTDCCSCVDICPKEDENDKSLESHVKVFESTNDDLFELFVTDEDSSEGRWKVYGQEVIKTSGTNSTLKCMVAYLSSCVDMYKCESSCIAMGASGYRWFHIGCCECVGKYCLNFGINAIRCMSCPFESDQVVDSGVDNL